MTVTIDASTDVARDTLSFFQKMAPEPNTKNFTTQLGCHAEEFAEMLEELTPETEELGNAVRDALLAVEHLARLLKQKGSVFVEVEKHPKFLDSLCDQLVTAIGVGHMAGFDIIGGLNEVNRSNFSKFDPETGNPIWDDNRKMIKGSAYSEADLTPFVGLT